MSSYRLGVATNSAVQFHTMLFCVRGISLRARSVGRNIVTASSDCYAQRQRRVHRANRQRPTVQNQGTGYCGLRSARSHITMGPTGTEDHWAVSNSGMLFGQYLRGPKARGGRAAIIHLSVCAAGASEPPPDRPRFSNSCVISIGTFLADLSRWQVERLNAMPGCGTVGSCAR